LNGASPRLFEDGLQQRDFVSVYDVARACALALDADAAVGKAINVGSGRPRTVREIAVHMARALGRPQLRPEVTGKCRVGDVRHCFADISEAKRTLGYAPEVDFDRGLLELTGWLDGKLATDRASEAMAELERRGLTL
jgi:dTDP-L-rhamnose 4-epimerase